MSVTESSVENATAQAMVTVATAGHVDHGKSSLILALTGTDPDRFPEEKARGLTIDLGFAFCRLASGTDVGFVDVPGHVRFIKNMLAGVGAVHAVLFVVAATEGWMPQSEEHLRILELLGVQHGMVALTKADAVDAETLELAQLDVEEHLAGSSLASAPIVTCDSLSGRGIEDVRSTLDAVLAAAPKAPDLGRPRLWVDRVFAARGAGTVVTGTLGGGVIAVDDEVEVGPQRLAARVRAVQSAHRQVGRALPGSRVALNLVGVERRQVTRGDSVVRPGQWTGATTVDVAVTMVPNGELRRRGRLAVYVGSGEHPVWFRLLDADGRYARVRFDAPLPLAPGDRLVARDSGRRRTVAGFEVLDVETNTRAKDAPGLLALPLGPRLLASHGWLRSRDLARLTGLSEDDARKFTEHLIESDEAVRVGDWLVATTTLEDVRARARERVVARHRAAPGEVGAEMNALATALKLEPAQLRAALEDAPDLVVERGLVRHASQAATASESPDARRLVELLDGSPFSPPLPKEAGFSPALVRALVREGVLVELDGVFFTASALERVRELVIGALADRGTLTVADVRDLLGSTRKYVVPIVGWLDRTGVTRRRGDDRVPGPASGVA